MKPALNPNRMNPWSKPLSGPVSILATSSSPVCDHSTKAAPRTFRNRGGKIKR